MFCITPSEERVRRAIHTLKNGKAAGPDDIPAEALKAAPYTSAAMVWKIIERIWKQEKVPQDWKEGFLVKLPKKGDQSECENHRGIMLLSVPGKVFNRIMLERLKTAVDKKLRDHQAGFRKKRSCTDQITTLRIIIEQSLEWNASLYVTFVDFEKAFDSLDRKSLWKLMRHYGIPEKFVTIIKNTYDGTSSRVLHEGSLSDKFEVKTGVRQGCLLSPFLFLLAVDWSMRESTEGRRNGIQWTLWNQLDDLDFADDIALLAHKYTQMQDKINQMEDSAAKLGLLVSKRKTKSMRINTTNDSPIMLDKGAVEDVSSFKYLGNIVNTNGGTDTIKNEDLWEKTGQESAKRTISRRKWSWIGHTLRRPKGNITKEALTWNPSGKRRRGRPRHTWRREMEAEMAAEGYSLKQLEKLAQNRVRWKLVIDGLCSATG